jgi:hypothetical protein
VIEIVVGAVGGRFAAAEAGLKSGSGSEGLRERNLTGLTERVDGNVFGNPDTLQLTVTGRGIAVDIERALQRWIEGLIGAEEIEFLGFDLRFLQGDAAAVFKCEQDGVTQAEGKLAVPRIGFQMRGRGQLFGTYARGQQAAIALRRLG